MIHMHLSTIGPLGRTSIWDKLHVDKLSIFAALSVADLFMTWQLVHATDGEFFYESNPVAEAWLSSYGWLGLSIYKALAMSLVVVSAVYVSVHRPRLGGRLLTFACLATAAVVIYSCYIAHDNLAERATNDDTHIVMHRARKLDQDMERQRSYQATLVQLGKDLVDGRRSLSEAIEEIGATDKARSPEWLDILHRSYPGHSDDECLAIHVGHHALVTVQHDAALLESMADRLQREFAALYGQPYRFDLAAVTLDRDPLIGGPDRRSAKTETMSEN